MKRIAQFFSAFSDATKPYQAFIVGIATTALLFGAVIAVGRLDLDWANIQFHWLVIAALTMPLSIFFNSLELQLVARAAAKKMDLASAGYYSCLATISNILPVPGSLLVRTHAIRSTGASLGKSGIVIVQAALLWVGLSLVAFFLFASASRASSGALFLGAILTIVATGSIIRSAGVRISAGFVGVRLAMILLASLRIFALFLMLDLAISFADSLIISLAPLVGASVAVIPGGLGIAEGAGALLAILLEQSAEAAFIAVALNRSLGLLAAGIVVLVLQRRPTLLDRSAQES